MMKKFSKIVIKIAAVLMFAAVFSGCVSTFSRHGSKKERGVKFGGPKAGQTVAYFDSAFRPEWKRVYAYAYYNNGERTNGGWPGVEMQPAEDGIYFYVLPRGLEDSLIIFNNGSGEQLGDVPIVKESQMMYSADGEWIPWFN